MTEKPLPEPVYGCFFCSEIQTFEPADLFWSQPLGTWVCEYCWSEPDEHRLPNGTSIMRGVSLKDELKRRGLNR